MQPNLRNETQVKGGSIGRYFNFETLISGSLVKIIYLIGLISITIPSLKMLFDYGSTQTIGLLVLVFGNLLWRIFCEGAILFFRIHESLVSIRDNLKS